MEVGDKLVCKKDMPNHSMEDSNVMSLYRGDYYVIGKVGDEHVMSETRRMKLEAVDGLDT